MRRPKYKNFNSKIRHIKQRYRSFANGKGCQGQREEGKRGEEKESKKNQDVLGNIDGVTI